MDVERDVEQGPAGEAAVIAEADGLVAEGVLEPRGVQVSEGSVPGNAAPAVPGDPLSLPGVRRTPTSLVVEADLSLETWLHLMEVLCAMAGAIAWWVGDALVWGERRFGEECYQAADPNLREQLQSWARVARKVPRRLRKPNLNWTHHRAVASLDDPREQERWLNLAETEGLRSGELSARIRADRREPYSGDDEPASEDAAHALACPHCGHDLEPWFRERGFAADGARSEKRRPKADPDLARTKIDRAYHDAQARLDLGGGSRERTP